MRGYIIGGVATPETLLLSTGPSSPALNHREWNMNPLGHDACTTIIVHACNMIIIHACTMIIINTCTMIKIRACTAIKVLRSEYMRVLWSYCVNAQISVTDKSVFKSKPSSCCSRARICNWAITSCTFVWRPYGLIFISSLFAVFVSGHPLRTWQLPDKLRTVPLNLLRKSKG